MYIKPDGKEMPKPEKKLPKTVDEIIASKCKVKIHPKFEDLVIKASELPEKKKLNLSPKTKKELVKKLDDVFSLFIRLRGADNNGIVQCFTSGKIMSWRQSQCGHFISRRHWATRWDETNCQIQSVSENVFNQGNAPEFARKLEEKYGKESVEMLHIKKNNTVKMGIFEYNLLIDNYTKEYKKLAKEKGIEI